ncbi:MAG TPA: twin-arginine translocase subunit TatC [Firmicutes bacterium]|nr:twin-arginine translocase subunit TatC [Bacillota bacterium]
MGKDRDGTMTVLEHLAELRRRLVLSGAAFLGAAIFAFSKADLIRELIARPVGGISFIFISPPEAFGANLRLSVAAGVVLAFPVILYQGLAFLFPALYRQEKKLFIGAVAGACTLFIAGSLFTYYVFIPFIWNFFLKFSSEQLQPYINISDYVTFFCSLTIAFGLVFQLPLLAWILARLELITARFLQDNWKYALLVILAVSAVITPPDIFSQVLMTVPLFMLYELAVAIVFLSERRRSRGEFAENSLKKREMVV